MLSLHYIHSDQINQFCLPHLSLSVSFSGGHVEVPPPAAGGEQEAGGTDQNSNHEERETAAPQRPAISAFHPHHGLLRYKHILKCEHLLRICASYDFKWNTLLNKIFDDVTSDIFPYFSAILHTKLL